MAETHPWQNDDVRLSTAHSTGSIAARDFEHHVVAEEDRDRNLCAAAVVAWADYVCAVQKWYERRKEPAGARPRP